MFGNKDPIPCQSVPGPRDPAMPTPISPQPHLTGPHPSSTQNFPGAVPTAGGLFPARVPLPPGEAQSTLSSATTPLGKSSPASPTWKADLGMLSSPQDWVVSLHYCGHSASIISPWDPLMNLCPPHSAVSARQAGTLPVSGFLLLRASGRCLIYI